MVNYFIYFAIVVGGAAVLALEILGTRILGPFYGVSLYLWSALISVTLAALSLGYAVGGRMADRSPNLTRFSIIIGLAGLWTLFVPWLRSPVLAVAEPLGLRSAVLVAATLLLFPPLMLLGMVSPYAIRLKASSLEVVGRTAGSLYAASTVASVVAALATGFYLIPNMGVNRLVFFIGLLLIVTAVIGLIMRNRGLARAGIPLVLIGALISGATVAPVEAADPSKGLVAVEQSAYAEIRVVDYKESRYMIIDGGVHTMIDTFYWKSHFPYVHVVDIAKRFYEEPGKMVLVGLGGGSLAKSFANDGWQVDAVEIDPVVTKTAYEYFNLKQSDAHVFDMDGRQYLISIDEMYDLVVMDAFGSSSIPFHLVTSEAFGLIKSRLEPNGILAMNIEAVGWDDIIVQSLAATMRIHFNDVVVLPIAEPPNTLGNIVIMASERTLELAIDNEPPLPVDRYSYEYDQAHAWDNRFRIANSNAPVLTDDLNPIDLWSERVNFATRDRLHKYFNIKGLGW